jgi:hypothetical protein
MFPAATLEALARRCGLAGRCGKGYRHQHHIQHRGREAGSVQQLSASRQGRPSAQAARGGEHMMATERSTGAQREAW